MLKSLTIIIHKVRTLIYHYFLKRYNKFSYIIKAYFFRITAKKERNGVVYTKNSSHLFSFK